MMIPSEDGPKASVRVSKETVSRKVQYSVFIDALFWGKTHHQPVAEGSL